MSKRFKQLFFREYKLRNIRLKEIGYKSYKDYIKSDLWKDIRTKHINHHNKCDYCNSKYRLNVHHLSYEKIGVYITDHLITLCDDCHTFSHAFHFAFPEFTIRQSSNKAKIIRRYLTKSANGSKLVSSSK